MSFLRLKRRAEGMTFEDEVYMGDLRSARAFGSKFVKCIFRDCKMGLGDYRNTRFDSCTFENCDLGKTDLSSSFFDGVTFLNCDLEQASFMGSHLNETSFTDCRMAYGETLFQGSTVRFRVTFLRCNLHGSNLDFRQTQDGALRFVDCNLWGAKASFGCAFWRAEFDLKTCQRFAGMLARIFPDAETRSTLMSMAGDQYAVVDRVMREAKS